MVLDLFTGMDGLGYALRALGIHPPPGGGLCIEMFETDPRCRRLLELRMASSHCHLSDETDSALVAGSVFWLVEDECRGTRRLLDRYPNLRRVLVVGGSPCVGFSKANTTSRGIDDPESRKLWIFPVLLNYLFLRVQSVFFIPRTFRWPQLTRMPFPLRWAARLSDWTLLRSAPALGRVSFGPTYR